MVKIGLTLGKYAPLHKGHQHVIETALSEMDRVVVLIYDAKAQTSIPLPVRASWIRLLYPTVEVIEGHDGPTVTGASAEIQQIQDAYIRQMIGSRQITAFYSSEPYGGPTSRALNARDRRVDPGRVHVPVSATVIRSDPQRYRAFVHPHVFRDLERYGEA